MKWRRLEPYGPFEDRGGGLFIFAREDFDGIDIPPTVRGRFGGASSRKRTLNSGYFDYCSNVTAPYKSFYYYYYSYILATFLFSILWRRQLFDVRGDPTCTNYGRK